MAPDSPQTRSESNAHQVARDKEIGADFPVSAKQGSFNNGGLAYKVNSLMMVAVVTTETCPKMNCVRTS
jgi:hypothetical protein